MNEPGFNFQLNESQTIWFSPSLQPVPFAFSILPLQELYNSPVLPDLLPANLFRHLRLCLVITFIIVNFRVSKQDLLLFFVSAIVI